MTDEKKAEEYVSPKIWGDTYFVNCCGDWSNEDMKKAYLDGLAEGKPKWHDLRKAPDDLPNNREEVLLYVKLHDKLEREHVLIGYRDYGDCLGEYCEDWGYVEPTKNCKYDFVDGEEVIAWCELPKFEE